MTYYEKIDLDEFCGYITSHKHLELDKRELDLINKYSHFTKELFTPVVPEFGTQYFYKTVTSRLRIFINKHVDEWYYIQYSIDYAFDYFYKCDQFDGFEKFINLAFSPNFDPGPERFYESKSLSYIKLFDNFSSENVSDYYSEIDYDLYVKFYNSTQRPGYAFIGITESEKIKIEELALKNDVDIKILKVNAACFKVVVPLSSSLLYTSPEFSKSAKSLGFFIHKVKDEYYYVSKFMNVGIHLRDQKYYLCDQLDGLLKLLSDCFSDESLLESNTNESGEGNFYTEISIKDWNEYIENIISLEKSEAREITHLLSRIGRSTNIRRKFTFNSKSDKSILYISTREGLMITKLEDYWFLVSVNLQYNGNGKFFKCDQMDGLVKLIEEIL